jgi:hypothetical protein
MANFAVIQHGVVINIVEAESKEIAESVTGFQCVAYTYEEPMFIGDLYSE